MTVDVHFYLKGIDPSSLPDTAAEYWRWLVSERTLASSLGRFHWTLLTYLQLKNSGLRVRLTDEPPASGIIVAHGDDVGNAESMAPAQYWVCLLVDRMSPNLDADFHVFHNPYQRLRYSRRFAYMPPWRQSDLLPRDPKRGGTVDHVGFFGYRVNLHDSLRSDEFVDELEESGLKLVCVDLKDWHDYRNIDVVLGVRTLGAGNLHPRKPALKLINAWAAGAAAVLGAESAYRYAGTPGEDYLEATSSRGVVDALRRLRSEPALFQALVANGRRKAADYTDERNTARWERLFRDFVIPDHLAIQASGYRQRARALQRNLLRRLAWRYRRLLDTT